MFYLRRFYDDADAGWLQGLGDRHGDLFGQPLLNCETDRDTDMNKQTEQTTTRLDGFTGN